MAQAERDNNKPAKNPLLWVSIIVICLIVYIFLASDRGQIGGPQLSDISNAPDASATQGSSSPADEEIPSADDGQIIRDVVLPPGAGARKYIREIREKGKPYPFDDIMAKAAQFTSEGSLADTHLIYFFAAREGYVDAMMVMAEMSDPTLFHAENNLMDEPDAVQAYKWYTQSLQKGFEPARMRLQNLQQWAKAEAEYGNAVAQQLLLNFN